MARLAITSDPSYANGYLLLGYAQLRLGQADSAREILDTGGRVAPEDARFPAYLAELKLGQQRWAEAEMHYHRALQFDPAQRVWQLNLAHAVRRQERLEEAAGLLENLVQTAPDYGPALAALGEVRSEMDDQGEAERLLRRAVAVDPTMGGAHYYLAWVLAYQDRWEDALIAARAAVELRPGDANYQRLLAAAEQKVGRGG